MIKHITIFIGLFSRHLLYNISNSKNPKKYKKEDQEKGKGKITVPRTTMHLESLEEKFKDKLAVPISTWYRRNTEVQ